MITYIVVVSVVVALLISTALVRRSNAVLYQRTLEDNDRKRSDRVAARNKMQSQEHEVLSPDFLETQTILFGGLGHDVGCTVCYPGSTKPASLDKSNREYVDSLPLSIDDLDEGLCDRIGHSYTLGSCDCIQCGQCKMMNHGTNEWFPGWGV